MGACPQVIGLGVVPAELSVKQDVLFLKYFLYDKWLVANLKIFVMRTESKEGIAVMHRTQNFLGRIRNTACAVMWFFFTRPPFRSVCEQV